IFHFPVTTFGHYWDCPYFIESLRGPLGPQTFGHPPDFQSFGYPFGLPRVCEDLSGLMEHASYVP
ncbi:MAG TPA: hypothetical protein PKV10_12115, partial [Thermoanaerobaculia bacterium]|nr:hypothetical protein [Thermoanaerobaculia bacterium]